MSDEKILPALPDYGSEKIIKRETVGHLSRYEQEVTLRFEDFSNYSRLGEETCTCGYNRRRGLWSGTASRMIGGNPVAFEIRICPACDIEEVVMPKRSRSDCWL